MKLKYIFFTVVFIMVYLSGCKEAHQKEDYLPLVKALHKIECDQLNKWGIKFTVSDTNIYTFRGIAFDKIMTKDPDAKLIAYYEDLNQKLAAMEYFMDDDEKLKYREDFRKEYLIPCLW
jgi:hypothetical protein